jgi:quinolinate synthase
MPDEHLGRNTAAAMGTGPVALFEPGKKLGGLDPATVRSSPCLVWKGYCSVHTHFTPEMVEKSRQERPGCKVIVHPECPREVVSEADASGSTEQIISYTEEQAEGSTVVIGTETNLVKRLARRFEGTKTVVPLSESKCEDMSRITLANLCMVLEGILKGPGGWTNEITVAENAGHRQRARVITIEAIR